jgi:MFS family permease
MPASTSSNSGNKNDDKISPINAAALYVTYVNIVLYALCFQLQRPIEPFLVQQLSKNAASVSEVTRTYGQLQSFFSIIQTLGSPLAGILLDRVGVRITSCIVFLASALSYGILSISTDDIYMLFYSKIPTAFQVRNVANLEGTPQMYFNFLTACKI